MTGQLTSNDYLPDKWIEKLLKKMHLDYGKQFIDQWAGVNPENLKLHWQKELAGFTREELTRGVKEMEKSDFPPSLPKFKRLCRPGVDPLVSYYEAVQGAAARLRGEHGEWSHPAVYWAAMPLAFDLGTQAYSQIRTRWEEAFNYQMSRGEWAEIPQPEKPVLQLAAPARSAESKQQASKVLKEIGAKSILEQSKEHTRWYRRILERSKNGDKTVTQYQLKEARMAAAEHGYEG